jgi:hypothetical protein
MEFHVGDRVVGTKDAFSHRVGKLGRVTRPQGKSSAFVLWDGEGGDHFAHRSQIVRIEEGPMRNEDKPKMWRDMTREEKGALLLAYHEGKDIEAFGVSYPDVWYETDPCWDDECPYRIKPEPKRERVVLVGRMDTPDSWAFFISEVDPFDSHRITFDTIDGKPDPSSIKIEEV